MSWDHANEALEELIRAMANEPPRAPMPAQIAPILFDLPQEAAVFGNPPSLFPVTSAPVLPADPTAGMYGMGVFE